MVDSLPLEATIVVERRKESAVWHILPGATEVFPSVAHAGVTARPRRRRPAGPRFFVRDVKLDVGAHQAAVVALVVRIDKCRFARVCYEAHLPVVSAERFRACAPVEEEEILVGFVDRS